MSHKTVITLTITTIISIAGYFAMPDHTNIASKASILESSQKIQESKYQDREQTRKGEKNTSNTSIVSTDMIQSPVINGDGSNVTNTNSSAPPVEVYFFETQFQTGGIDGCENKAYDESPESPESPCQVMSQKLTQAVSTAVKTFHRVVGKYFDEDEFFKIFMIDEATGKFKETLDENLHLTPNDPVGSGERLAHAYIEAKKLRKKQ